VTLDRRTTQELIFWQGVLNMVGTVISWLLMRSPSIDVGVRQAATFIVGLALVIVARRFRERWRDDVTSSVFVVGILPVVALIWAMTTYRAHGGKPYCVFQEYQLSCLTVATLAPPRVWAGLVGIALFAGSAFIQFAMFDASERAIVAGGALEGVVAFAAFAVVLLFFRLRSRRITERAAREIEERRMMRRWSRAVSAIRDLANNPLQLLTIEVEIIRRKFPEAKEHAERLARTTKRLNELNALVVTESGEASFDALGVLRDSKPEL
jgi:hypothetical protein